MLMASAELPWCGQQASHVCYTLLCFYWDVKHRCVCMCVCIFHSVSPLIHKFLLLFSQLSSCVFFLLSHNSLTFIPTPPLIRPPPFPTRGWQRWEQNTMEIMERKSVKGCKKRWRRGNEWRNILSQFNTDDRNRLWIRHFCSRTFHRGAVSQMCKLKRTGIYIIVFSWCSKCWHVSVVLQTLSVKFRSFCPTCAHTGHIQLLYYTIATIHIKQQ